MRILVIGVAALLLSLPAVTPSRAYGVDKSAQAVSTTFSADEKKPVKKKMAKKTAKKKEKVEYMRAAPM